MISSTRLTTNTKDGFTRITYSAKGITITLKFLSDTPLTQVIELLNQLVKTIAT